MSEPFLGEIRMIGFAFAPRGWAACDGQELLINQNQALYALLGTTYGGDGRAFFALPDLRGRIPIHATARHPLGQQAGEERTTLDTAELPGHAHMVSASSATASGTAPGGQVWADAAIDLYAPDLHPVALSSTALAPSGASHAHENRMPFLALNFVIALQGLFPSRN